MTIWFRFTGLVLKTLYWGTLVLWGSYTVHAWRTVRGAGFIDSIHLSATKLIANSTGLLEGKFSEFFSDGATGLIAIGLLVFLYVFSPIFGPAFADYDNTYRFEHDPGMGEHFMGSPHYRSDD